MARPKGPEQRVPVKMRVNIGLMDRLRQLAAENRYSVPKMLTVIMEETLADLPADYELHEIAEIYTLTKNQSQFQSDERISVAGDSGGHAGAGPSVECEYWRCPHQFCAGLSGSAGAAVK